MIFMEGYESHAFYVPEMHEHNSEERLSDSFSDLRPGTAQPARLSPGFINFKTC